MKGAPWFTWVLLAAWVVFMAWLVLRDQGPICGQAVIRCAQQHDCDPKLIDHACDNRSWIWVY